MSETKSFSLDTGQKKELLKTVDVTSGYEKKTILRKLNLSVHTGEVAALFVEIG